MIRDYIRDVMNNVRLESVIVLGILTLLCISIIFTIHNGILSSPDRLMKLTVDKLFWVMISICALVFYFILIFVIVEEWDIAKDHIIGHKAIKELICAFFTDIRVTRCVFVIGMSISVTFLLVFIPPLLLSYWKITVSQLIDIHFMQQNRMFFILKGVACLFIYLEHNYFKKHDFSKSSLWAKLQSLQFN